MTAYRGILCGTALLIAWLTPTAQSNEFIARSQSASTQPEVTTVECRVLEAHASDQPAASVVVFHQRDKQDQARLASLLREHSETSVEFQPADGNWHKATVFRLKSCFGRGLLLIPEGTAQLKDGDGFLLKFPPQ